MDRLFNHKIYIEIQIHILLWKMMLLLKKKKMEPILLQNDWMLQLQLCLRWNS